MRHMQSRPGRLLPVLVALVVAATAIDTLVRIAPGFTRLSHAALPAFPARRAGFVVHERLSTRSHGGATDSTLKSGDRRDDVLRRLAEDGPGTYLPAMLAQVDSAIRRWPDDRFTRPLKIGVASRTVPGFQQDFAGTIPFAINQWNGIQLPIQLDFRGHDTTDADITVGWVPRLDSGRTGKADVTWDQRQYIRKVAVSLATHTPDGRELNVSEMTALALHELGHAIGLAHSGDPNDALYPMTRALELSSRDRATARLLYALPPGSLRK